MSAAAKIVVMTAEEFTEALSRVAEASARRALELAQSRAHEEPSCRRWVAAGMPHDGVGGSLGEEATEVHEGLYRAQMIAPGDFTTEGAALLARARKAGVL